MFAEAWRQCRDEGAVPGRWFAKRGVDLQGLQRCHRGFPWFRDFHLGKRCFLCLAQHLLLPLFQWPQPECGAPEFG